MVKVIDTKEEWDKVHKDAGDKVVVVDFYADWCGPCRVISPKFVGFSKKYTDFVFIKVNVDENAEVAESCNISAMPTFQFFKNGKKIDEVVGANETKLEEAIKKHL